jgi:hypothetical protein
MSEMASFKSWRNSLDHEKVMRIRTWLFVAALLCGALIVGLSYAPWADTCGNETILGYLNADFFSCGTVTGAESEVIFGFGDGRATAGLGVALLAACALALAFRSNALMWMIVATMVSGALAIVALLLALEYSKNGSPSEALQFLIAAAFATPIFCGAFVWMEPDSPHEE